MDNQGRDWIALAREHGGISSAAVSLGVPRHTLSNRIAMQALRANGPPEVDDSEAKAAALAEDNRELRAELRRRRSEKGRESAAIDAIFGLSRESVPIPEWVSGGGDRTAPRRRAGTPVLMLGDQHLGEVVRAGQAYGNAYNTEIGIGRQQRVIERAIGLCFEHMTETDYPGIVVPLMGDTVTGDIHDELKATNDENLLASVLTAAGLTVASLQRLADRFGRVFAPAVAGNHGRTTRRIEAKDFTEKNFDWLTYRIAMRELEAVGDDRIVIHCNESNANRFDVLGHRFMQMHGHDLGVKGGDGIIGALGPIMRGRLKVGAQQQALGHDFDTLLLGHWHQYITLPGLIVNNTLKGYDEYAATMLRAKPSTPSQALFFVHPRHGITARWEVFAEDPPKPTGHEGWASWES